jgi:hypothetical protein
MNFLDRVPGIPLAKNVPQPQRLGRHFNQFVFGDELDRLLQIHHR